MPWFNLSWMMIQLAYPATKLENLLVSSTSPFLSPPFQHPTNDESWRFYLLSITWIGDLIHFTPSFRVSERLINHPALPRTKGFPRPWDFQIFLKPDNSGQTRISWFCSLIIFTWNGVYSLYPFSSGVLIYSPISLLQVSYAPIQPPNCNSIVLSKLLI